MLVKGVPQLSGWGLTRTQHRKKGWRLRGTWQARAQGRAARARGASSIRARKLLASARSWAADLALSEERPDVLVGQAAQRDLFELQQRRLRWVAVHAVHLRACAVTS